MGNIIVLAVLVALVAAVCASLFKNKKKGRSSCGAGCGHCAMSGMCHKKSSEGEVSPPASMAAPSGDRPFAPTPSAGAGPRNAPSGPVITVAHISGMMCSMCESHINDALRNHFTVMSVKSSHKKGLATIKSKEPLDQEELRTVIESTGYTLTGVEVR